MAKTIRVGEETYSRLVEQAGRLQATYRRQVSLDETVRYLIDSCRPRGGIGDLAGTWRIDDEELKEIREGLAEGWRKWR